VVCNFRLIVDKIDKDADGSVSGEELKDWIQYTQKRYIVDDVERQWKAHNPENKEKISWEEYKKMVYGFMDGKNTVITVDKIFSSTTLGMLQKTKRFLGGYALSADRYFFGMLKDQCPIISIK